MEQDHQQRICEYYVQRKKRQCKFKAINGSKFCSSHCSDIEGKLQCPFQKGVFIDISKYDNHMQNCPRIKQKKKVAASTWFEKGINYNNQNQKNQQNQQKPQKMELDNIVFLSAIQPQIIQSVISRIIDIYLQKFKQQIGIDYIMSTPSQELPQLTNDHKQAHLLAQIGYKNNLIRKDLIYVEFGAGKGILSFAIAKKVEQVTKSSSKNVLLQRQSRRNKFDKHFRGNPYFQRYKSDVSDFSMKMLSKTMVETIKSNSLKKKDKNQNNELDLNQVFLQLQKCQVVGICKHMCGGALDISVRALLQGNDGGCIMASCCHHLCSYDTYLNLHFFEKCKLSADEIQLIFRISSWGTKSTFIDKSEINLLELKKKRLPQFKQNQKTIIGRMCKRLIDLGRAQYLNGKLIKYCSDQLTPQNFAIIYQKPKIII